MTRLGAREGVSDSKVGESLSHPPSVHEVCPVPAFPPSPPPLCSVKVVCIAPQVKQYGAHIGIDAESDSQLLWLAEEALCAPLPARQRGLVAPDNATDCFD